MSKNSVKDMHYHTFASRAASRIDRLKQKKNIMKEKIVKCASRRSLDKFCSSMQESRKKI